MKISQKTIQNIQDALKIDEIISDFIVLKKKGKNLWACCPFHNERSPSFSVSPQKGFFKCFGCDAKGDAITFLQLLEGMNFVEAVTYIAEKYSIQIEEEFKNSNIDSFNKDDLYTINDFAKNWFQNNLKNSKDASHYIKDRSISDESVVKFDIGFSSKDWRELYHELLKEKFDSKVIKKSNLVIFKEGKAFDRFRNRIIFPIHNLYGKIIAFAGRILADDEHTAKYINSPESELYNKSKIVYGIFQAKSDIIKNDFCILVEGYTDVISLHQAGIKNVVASGGTSLTQSQIKLLKRFTNNITIVFDQDEAGVNASKRNIDLILEEGMDVKVVSLPDQTDPDSFVNKIGKEKFLEYFKDNEQDFITYSSQSLSDQNYSDPTQRSKIINQIIHTISLIPDIIKRTLFIKKCSTILEIEEDILSASLSNKLNKSSSRRHSLSFQPSDSLQKNRDTIQNNKGVHELEKYILKLLVCYGTKLIDTQNTTLKDYIFNETKDIEFKNVSYQNLYKYVSETNIIGNQLLYSAPEHLRSIIIDLLSENVQISQNWSEKAGIYPNDEKNNLQKSAFKAILKLKLKIVSDMINKNQKKIIKENDEEKLEELMRIHSLLKEQSKYISESLGIVIY